MRIAYKNTNIFIGSDFYRSHIFFLFKKINCYLLPLKITAFGFTQMKRGGPTQPCYLKKTKKWHIKLKKKKSHSNRKCRGVVVVLPTIYVDFSTNNKWICEWEWWLALHYSFLFPKWWTAILPVSIIATNNLWKFSLHYSQLHTIKNFRYVA